MAWNAAIWGRGLGAVGALLLVAGLFRLHASSHASVLENGPREQMLWSWRELGSGLDMAVPNSANANAADVGGRLVQMHAPSGRMPGYGGGQHFIEDITHPERLASRRSHPRFRVVSGAHQLHSAPEALPSKHAAAAQTGPGLDAIETAYRRAARLAEQQQHANAAQDLQNSERTSVEKQLPALRTTMAEHVLCGVTGAPTSCEMASQAVRGALVGTDAQHQMVREVKRIQQQLRAASSASKNAAKAQPAPKNSSVKAESSALEKAAESLDSITKSLQSPSARNPRRLAHIAASLSTLSRAMQGAGGPSTQSSEHEAEQVLSVAERRKKQEQRIEADVMYHLDQVRFAQALQAARNKQAHAAQGWFSWL